jgi:chromosome segregation ATPase
VLLVLILLACPVFITQATIAPKYREAYEQEIVRAELHAQSARQAQLALSRAQEEAKVANTTSSEELARRQQKIDSLFLEITQQRQENVKLMGDISKNTLSLADLDKSYRETLEISKLLSADLAAARKEIDKLNDMYRRTDELLKQKQADIDRLERVARVLREELVNREEQIKDLEQKIETMKASGLALSKDGTAEAAPVSDLEVTGTLTAVKDDMASINIGAGKGIVRGMKLIVYRGSSFVANLQVAEVDAYQAAGILVDRRLDPMPGDKVTTKLK